MISLCAAVRDALGRDAVCGQSGDLANMEELVCWRESGNHEFARADGGELLAECTYTVDIFAPVVEAALSRLSDVNARLAALGLRRVFTHTQFEERMTHIIARFRAVADAQGNVYQ